MTELRSSNLVVNQQEAYELACLKREESNLARSYLELRTALEQIVKEYEPGYSTWDFVGIAKNALRGADETIGETSEGSLLGL